MLARRWFLALVIAFQLVALGGLPAGRARAADSDPNQQIVSLINAERVKRGLAPLAISSELTSSANAYARAMATGGFLSHVGPDGSTMQSRDEAAGYLGWTFLGENIAAGQPTPEEAVAAWMASEPHRENILSPNPRETGVGSFVLSGAPYVYYWVEEFGNRPAAPSNTAPAQPLAARAPTVSIASNGHTLSGIWLSFVQSHGALDATGLARSDVVADPLTGQQVQYFQRTVLEYHPENPSGQQILPRLLGDVLYPGADPPASPGDPPPGPSSYFPLTGGAATGLGHYVADYTRTGQPIYFKTFFDQHGGVATFGYPKEEPKLRDGLWTQRFQAAVFQYHPENDRPGLEPYRVQLELLGDEYIQSRGLSFH